MLDAASHLPIIRLYKAYSCYQNGKRKYKKILKSWQMRLASQDIQGITKRLYKLDLFIFLESLKSFKRRKIKDLEL
jgi:hypothetical protein